VYTYDSLAEGLGRQVADEFEKKTGIKTSLVTFGSCGEALNQVILEGARTQADLLLGIDHSMLARAKDSGILSESEFNVSAIIPKDLWLEESHSIVPFDYGYLAFVYDSKRVAIPEASISLWDFSHDDRWKNRVVIQDPRTSSIGLSFLLWTHFIFDEKRRISFWKQFTNQLLTITPGWSSAYGLFLNQEVDFVLSYTTSPAYHIEVEKNMSMRALLFSEGHYRQVEGAALVKFSKHRDWAKKWIEILLSHSVQSQLPLGQWMYPVRTDVSLPKSFEGLIQPKVIRPKDFTSNDRREWIQKWVNVVSKLP